LKPVNKEQIATSILLATFHIVPELLDQLIKDVGLKITNKTTFKAFTEVNLVKKTDTKKNDRPDGYLYIKNRNEWSALVEAKVGNTKLEAGQICRYLELAKTNNINAVITISNEFSPRVDQSPIDVPKKLLNKVKLYHFSWRLLLSNAQLLKRNANLIDREKLFVLEELIRFLRDDSVGKKSFSMMPSSWSSDVTSGNKLEKSSPYLQETANALVEEFSEIALNLTDHLGVDCSMKLATSFVNDKSLWQKSIMRKIVDGDSIICQYIIPDAANTLFVEIDIAKCIFAVGMEINAPEDKKTNSGKINWLKRQITDHGDKNFYIKVRWRYSSQEEMLSLDDFTKETLDQQGNTKTISAFIPLIRVQETKVFKSRKLFISELEKIVEKFYDCYGQNLKAWVAKPPKPIELESNNEEDWELEDKGKDKP